MTVSDILDGDPIQASWGQAVADAINEGATVRTSATSAITTTQTQIIGRTLTANTLRAGSCFRFDVWGTVTSTVANVVTFRLRCGAASLTGTIVTTINPTATTTAANDPFHLQGLVTVRSIGASGTMIGGVDFVGVTNQPFAVGHRAVQETSTIAIDTTVDLVLEATAVTAAGTTSVTVRQATIETVRP